MALNCRANRENLNSMYKGIIYQYKIGNKYYVGKTLGLERKRIDKHKHEALTVMRDGPFQRAIRKYGWDTVRTGYSVIETLCADSKDELNLKLYERETYWIRKRNALVPNGYNVYESGQITIPHTKNKAEVYKKVSETLKGKNMNCPETSRPIYCIEQKKWYPSAREAERTNGISRGSVGKAANGTNCKAGGLSWSYDGSVTKRTNRIKASRKPIYCIETGKEYASTYAASKEMFGAEATKKKNRIQAALKHGWAVDGKHFRYIEHDNPVLSETEV